jgi:hypothetical protein
MWHWILGGALLALIVLVIYIIRFFSNPENYR